MLLNTELAMARGLWRTLAIMVVGLFSPLVMLVMVHGFISWVETLWERRLVLCPSRKTPGVGSPRSVA